MPKYQPLKNTAGFAALEVVLLIVVIIAIVGVGGFVLHQSKAANKTLDASNKSATASQATGKAVSTGTTTSIDQLTTQDAKAEAGIDTAADNLAQQDSTNGNSSLTNVGGAFNEDNL